MSKANFFRAFKNYGLMYCYHRIFHQLVAKRPIRRLRTYHNCVSGKHGLEVGGPSAVFSSGGLIPLYDFVGSLDNCNFSSSTIWARHDSGATFRYSEIKPAGLQYISEGTDLPEINDNAYDFILSSHMLEHSANPLRALKAWGRVLKPNGLVVLLLPHKRWTFDHKRPVTSLAHLIEDFENGIGEDDLTHLPEILRLHDLSRDPDAGGYDAFKKRSENNSENRGMHHHVFDPALVRAVLEQADFSIELLRTAFKDHIIAIARKSN